MNNVLIWQRQILKEKVFDAFALLAFRSINIVFTIGWCVVQGTSNRDLILPLLRVVIVISLTKLLETNVHTKDADNVEVKLRQAENTTSSFLVLLVAFLSSPCRPRHLGYFRAYFVYNSSALIISSRVHNCCSDAVLKAWCSLET